MGGAHGISLRDLPGTARPEQDRRGGREMRCARLLAHALQCIFIRAQRSAAAEDRGGRQRGERGVGVGRMEGGGCEGDERQEERKAEDSVCDRGAKKKEVVSQTSGSTLGRGGAGVGGGL